MSETNKTAPATTEAPKKRRARKASNYLVLRSVQLREPDPNAPKEDTAAGGLRCFEQVAANGTRKGCVKAIEDEKITGELMIVCVRDRITVSIKQQVEMKHVRT